MEATFLSIFENIGSVIGVLITLMTFWGIVSKKPLEALRKMIREESKKVDEDFQNEVRQVLERADKCDNTMIVLLRHAITETYEKYKDEKKFPTHVKEDIWSLYQQYESWGGNSYVHTLMEQMKDWNTY